MADEEENEEGEEGEEQVPEELIALLASDAFGLRTYRCNAPPVQPFEGMEDEQQIILGKVFAPGPWRIDGMRERRSAHHDAIMKDLAEKGAESEYATAICPFSGVNALHACAINGYLTLFKALVEVGQCDPTLCAPGLATMMSSRLERERGADAKWMCKRRGHRPVLLYIKALPAVEEAQKSLDVQLVTLNKVHHQAVEAAKAKAAAEKLAREEEEARIAAEEKKRKEKEKAQRKVRDEIQAFDHTLRQKRKALGELDIDWKTSEFGQEASLSALEDEQSTMNQSKNRCKAMLKKAESVDIGGEMKKPEGLIVDIDEIFADYVLLWDLDNALDMGIAVAMDTRWGDLDTEGLEESAKKLMGRCKKLPKPCKASSAFKALDKRCKDFTNMCPLITSLKTPCMKKRHWDELLAGANATLDATPLENPNIELSEIIALNLTSPAVAVVVEEATDKAVKEAKQEETLGVLEATWKLAVWKTTPYDKDPSVPLLGMDEKDFEQLESDLLTLQSMVAGRYDFFKVESTAWQLALQNVGEVMSILSELQRMWSYLEPLFIGSDEVKRELPETAAKFKELDTTVRSLLKEAAATGNVKEASNKEGLIASLEDITAKQDLCKKSLNEFLDSKRMQFARFYFVSESDLLDILSNGSNPPLVMKHVDKVMLATADLTLGNPDSSGRPAANYWVSGIGQEYVEFVTPVKLVGKVEIYFQTILDAQSDSLRDEAHKSVKRYLTSSPRTGWLQDTMKMSDGRKNSCDAAQIALLVAAIYYTKETEAAMTQMLEPGVGEQPFLDFQTKTLKQLTDLIKCVMTDLDSATRTKVMCMITYDAHSRDMIEGTLRMKMYQISSFKWQSQLKMKYDAEQDRWLALILNATFDYGFEYLGNGPRLVVTPLTDRVYVTATQALNLCMGCAPAGPAGTGKTESTKDLASALGKCCYVFNCSPEMDYKSLGNIFKGLACSGSWGCFDEFNRLIPEVLSVCTVQFKAVCAGVKKVVTAQKHSKKNGTPMDEQARMTTIEGDIVKLNETCGAYITMNPGYLGRSSLPEGLKALFRPMTVMVPDLVMICENMLMAQGFVTSKSLASKFYTLYSLLKDLLSKQEHYDWGLRAIKSVLVVAGMLLRSDPNGEEDDILMRALRDFNIAKIVKVDEVVFFGLLNDLFPGRDPPRVVDDALQKSVDDMVAAMPDFVDDTMKLKTIQLDELLQIRHCVFVMGPPGAFKSTSWKYLAKAKRIVAGRDSYLTIKDINPKTMPTQDLYGYINMATRDWKDGLLSTILRGLSQVPDTDPKWLMLDGDLDANWIESMNSVMDDNRLLTLASNERIPLKPHMRMIFEIRDLKHATPATVSRAGILYISTDEGFQWRSMVNTWVLTRDESKGFTSEAKEWLTANFDEVVGPALLAIRKLLFNVVQQPTTLVNNILRLLDCFLTPEMMATQEHCQMTFSFCAAWALGSALGVADDGRDYMKVFSEWWKKTFKKRIAFPGQGLIFDYWLNTETFEFAAWTESPAYAEIVFNSKDSNMSDVTVPTGESASVSFWLAKLVRDHHCAMLAGPSGTGKTQTIMGQLKQLDASETLYTTINMNFFTDGLVLQSSLEGVLQKKTGSLYGPPGACHMVYFIDDFNLPKLDNYNTQSAISLVRQHLDYGHWYDISKLAMKTVEKCQYVAALNPTAGSMEINPRLQRHFTTFNIAMPTDTSLGIIYETFLNGHLDSLFNSNASLMELVPRVIKSTLNLHKDVSENFRKTAANFHYEFNIRHVAGVFQGLLMTTPAKFGEAQVFADCWVHEAYRVYGDRLVSPEDLAKFEGLLVSQANKGFGEFTPKRFFGDSRQPLTFCHFLEGIGEEPIYDQIHELSVLQKILDQALDEYNESNAQMDLVLFEDALNHVCRITRIINNPSGHALLVGVGGSGKKSLSRLASFICGYQTSTIQISATYGINDLKTDLQEMYKKAGIKGEGVMFLFTDAEITNERFLVYLNDLLGSADIAGLYAQDEKDEVIGAVTKKAKAAGVNPEPGPVYDFFLGEVRRNLHVCLCCSPVGPDFSTRCQRFPALVNCTVIDWFQPWPEQALYSVGCKFLEAIEDLGSPEVRDQLQTFMPELAGSTNVMANVFKQMEGRFVYTTPKSYLELLKLYSELLEKKRAENDTASLRLQRGVKKLEEVTAVVEVLKESIAGDVADAEEKKAESDKIAKVCAAEKEVVDMETENANIEEKKVTKIAVDVKAKKESAEADLAQAEPAVEAAMAALDTLDVKDLQMCKTMSKPPPGVDDVFNACLCLLASYVAEVPVQKSGKVKDKDRTWDCAKKTFLKDPKAFLDNLKAFKVAFEEGKVPAVNFKEVRMYLAMEHFKPEIITGKNSAAGGLCNWCVNIVIYYDVVSMVEPKKKLVRDSIAQLDAAQTQLGEVKAKVKALEEKLQQLMMDLDGANRTKAAAEATVEKGMAKLGLAGRLLGALSSEQARWIQSVTDLGVARDLLVGDTLLSAAFISYIGPFTKQYRTKLLDEEWLPRLLTPKKGVPVPMSKAANPLSALTNDSEVALWQTCKLPADPVSTENGSIVERSTRWPLLIDPQLQGVAWVKAQNSKDPACMLRVSRLGTPQLLPTLKECLVNGLPLLVENMGESIEASIMPAVQRAKMKRGGRFFLKLGEDEIEYHDSFRMFLQTKLSNPHYPPEIQAECTLVNFTVTPAGLEDQLLALVVSKERPDLAKEKKQLVQQSNTFKIKMIELEDEILARLAAAEGDITEDKDLIEGLEAAKLTSNDINEKLAIGRRTTEAINNTSERFRLVARRGSQIFFIMNELTKIHTYYIYSLNAFVVVFLKGIDDVQALDKPKDDGKKKSMLSRFKKAAKKVVKMQRFPWSRDILGEATQCESVDQDLLMKLLMGGGKKKSAACSVGDTVECDLGVGCVKKIVLDGKAYVLETNKKFLVMPADACQKFVDYPARCTKLIDMCSSVCFNYVRRGLFERDKLMVSSLFVMTLQIADSKLKSEYMMTLLEGRGQAGDAAPDSVSSWLPELVWPKVRALQQDQKQIPLFGNLLQSIEDNADKWNEWYNSPQPELNAPPGGEDLSTFEVVMLLGAMRGDRVTMGMQKYISESYGDNYVFQPPFDMRQAYTESTASTPMFFVLFPGVDPTVWIEEIGEKFGFTSSKNNFINISMGQGQEAPAEAMIEKMATEGGWILLQNLHLMQSWLPRLERKLEVCSEHAHQDFRCYVNAEAPGFSYQKNIPESLLQGCIKISNEAPSDIKSNLERAWAPFDQARLEESSMPAEFRACLFGLCFFHSAMLGRKRFGQQGWSRNYGFNMGDLSICADVLQNYLEENGGVVPWEDLRYIFGEIMYGGHITDFWDRKTSGTYLEVSFHDGLLKQHELGHGFKSPDPNVCTTSAGYLTHLETLPAESPLIYGLHMNSEIAYNNNATASLLATILGMKAGGTGGAAAGGGDSSAIIDELEGKLPELFDMIDLNDTAQPIIKGRDGPYIVVLLQEAGRMNVLTGEIARSLDELRKGLLGQLNMSQKMEDLLSALIIKQVPGRNPFHTASWEKFAWPSMKGLQDWFDDLIVRCRQVTEWCAIDGLQTPISVWFPGLFNPTAFLTGIKQVTARLNSLALDKMATETHVTAFSSAEECGERLPEGMYIHGLFIEGAQWGSQEESKFDYVEDATQCAGILRESKPKELLPPMPVIYVKAVQIQPTWDPQSVGYIRPELDLYNCPVYLTTFRGPTWVFVATLKTDEPASHWVLRGVALVAQLD